MGREAHRAVMDIWMHSECFKLAEQVEPPSASNTDQERGKRFVELRSGECGVRPVVVCWYGASVWWWLKGIECVGVVVGSVMGSVWCVKCGVSCKVT